MFNRLIEVALPRIIGMTLHRFEKLTEKERSAKITFVTKLQFVKRRTKKPIVIGMVGLVGSGKSSVADELSKTIGATLVKGDDIRVELRRQGERFDRARAIAEHAVKEIVDNGGNAILDSDFVDSRKRASLRAKAQSMGAHLMFIRTTCDVDVAVGRICSATYRSEVDDFFGGATSKWKWKDQNSGAVVKIREMWRRTPQHYRWINRGGGTWVLKKFPIAFLAEIDTTDPVQWKRDVKKCTDLILKL